MQDELPKLGDEMFFDKNIDICVAHIRESYASVFNFAQRLNVFSHQILQEVTIKRDDLKQALLAALLLRSLQGYQATLVLAERGMAVESEVTLRSLLEVTFKIVAVAKDDEAAKSYVQQNVRFRRKLAAKYGTLDEIQNSPEELELASSIKDEMSKRISEENIAERTTEWFSKRAGLESLYNSAYAVLSDVVHANVGSLELFMSFDDNNQLRNYKYGFSDYRYAFHVTTAAEALILCLKAAFSKVDMSRFEELNALHQEFVILFEKTEIHV